MQVYVCVIYSSFVLWEGCRDTLFISYQAYWSACQCFCETHLDMTSRSLIRTSAWNHQVANPSQITEEMRLCSENLYLNHLPGVLWNQTDEGRMERKTVTSHNIENGYLEKTHLEILTVADWRQQGPITKEQAIWQITVCRTRDKSTILYTCSNSTKYSEPLTKPCGSDLEGLWINFLACIVQGGA